MTYEEFIEKLQLLDTEMSRLTYDLYKAQFIEEEKDGSNRDS